MVGQCSIKAPSTLTGDYCRPSATIVAVAVWTVRQLYRVSKKLCQCYFLNNSVKRWPTLIIFGVQHHKET